MSKNRRLGYFYNEGEVVNGFILLKKENCIIEKKDKKGQLKKYNIKAYLARCQVCGYTYIKQQYDIERGNKCLCCSGLVTVKGVNDIATTHPHLIKYFANKEDSTKYTSGSNKKVEIICPTCGERKIMAVVKLSNRRFSCAICNEKGISNNEKFMRSLLIALGVDFKREKTFTWSGNRRYDFYIPSINCIIEMHGKQHYKEGCFEYYKNGLTLEKQLEIDKCKRELAINNNIDNYVEIDCSGENLHTIKQEILNSPLKELLNINEAIFKSKKFTESITSSFLSELVKYWSSLEDKSTTKIMERFDICRETAIRYLRLGEEIGICDYSSYVIVGGKVGRKTVPIKVIELDMTFTSFPNLRKYFNEEKGIKLDRNSLRKAIKNNRKYKNYTFIYI